MLEDDDEKDNNKRSIHRLDQIAIQVKVAEQGYLTVLNSGATVSVISRRRIEELSLSA